tara:strand:+ start:4430 stop:5116 length:687 start_codon:yes stop_codon:yes gene_type:complete
MYVFSGNDSLRIIREIVILNNPNIDYMADKAGIINAMRRLYDKGYIAARDGNISFKPRNKDFFYITAGSVRKDELKSDEIIKVNFNDNATWYDKNSMHRPSRELKMHYFLHKKSQNYVKDLYVVHAHPPNAIAFMGINPVNNELNNINKVFPELNVGIIGRNVPLFEAGSNTLATACLNHLCSRNTTVGLKQHGTLCIGSDLAKIEEDIETLEYHLDIYFKAISLKGF